MTRIARGIHFASAPLEAALSDSADRQPSEILSAAVYRDRSTSVSFRFPCRRSLVGHPASPAKSLIGCRTRLKGYYIVAEGFAELVRLMARLRAPDGCPWDRKQTHESLKPYLVEEAYEVLESIDEGNIAALREELGDLLLQVLFHAQIGAEHGRFTISDVIEGLSQKLIRRHPHVFGPKEAATAREPGTAEEVLTRWETIKEGERQESGQAESALDGIPKTLPALLRAFQIQSRASRVGFDWSEPAPVMAKVNEELEELREALAPRDAAPKSDREQTAVEAEFGDVLFALVNLARFLKVNPEEALRKATNRFIDRFRYIEEQAARRGRRLKDMTLAEMDVWWEEAKVHTPRAGREGQSHGT
jgi:tetrapyrrole methylase family protein/MazG family protein